MIALAADSWMALGLAALAAAWLARRGVRLLKSKSGSCACPSSESSCGAAGKMADDLKAAAARGAAKAGQPPR